EAVDAVRAEIDVALDEAPPLRPVPAHQQLRVGERREHEHRRRVELPRQVQLAVADSGNRQPADDTPPPPRPAPPSPPPSPPPSAPPSASAVRSAAVSRAADVVRAVVVVAAWVVASRASRRW